MLIERLVFIVIAAVFIYIFWTGIAPKLALIKRAKPMPRLGDLWPRAKRVFMEVLLQSRVIKARPFAGTMHALVFAGFAAFAVETMNHFAKFFGLAFLPADSLFRTAFLSAIALLTLVGINMLAIRRFVFRPKALGGISYKSGAVALLINILMLTFLIGFRIPDHSVAGHVNWWLHSLSILAFIALIPRSKHLHLIFAPVAVYFRSFRIAELPKLDFEKEEYGLLKLQDMNRKNVLDVVSCVECGRCQDNCPAYGTGKELNPKELVLALQRGLLTKAHDADIVGDVISTETLWQCTTCGACENVCPVGVEHLPFIIGMRRGQIANGEVDKRTGTVLTALEQGSNPWKMALEIDIMKHFEIPEFQKGMEYLLWTGCAGLVDDRYQKVMASVVKLLKAANVTFGTIPANQNCAGDLARRIGNEMVFEALATENIERLKELGFPKVITACPHCLQTLRNDYPSFGGVMSVLHHSQVLGALLAEKRLVLVKAAVKNRITYHDPCYLGRYNKVFDAPRDILKASGSNLLELPQNREKSFCCGAGGGRMFLTEEKGTAINVRRSEEIAGVSPDKVVTGCPFCITMLTDGLKSLGKEIPVLDVSEFMLANLA
ncbi:MAG: (Fe-S)-binding protein [bacterium]|nr:(Fe-S)-binding protein [bacterium]